MDSMVNHYTARQEAALRRRVHAGRPRRARAPTTRDRRLRAQAEEALSRTCRWCSAASRRRSAGSRTTTTGATACAARSSLDCQADLVVYGMGERPILEIASRARRRRGHLRPHRHPRHRGALPRRRAAGLAVPGRGARSRGALAALVRGGRRRQEARTRSSRACTTSSTTRTTRGSSCSSTATRSSYVNPPAPPPSTELIDAEYELPFTRLPHPMYGEAKIPAWEQIRFSVTIMRGCAAGCSFCCITEHQGRDVVSRSEASVLREIEGLKNVPGLDRRGQRHRRRHREHVAHGLYRRGLAPQVPPRLLRVPDRLREVRHRSRPLDRADAQGARAARREARVRRQRRPLRRRLRRREERRRVHPRAGREPRRRTPQDCAGAHLAAAW